MTTETFQPESDLLRTLFERGYAYQITDEKGLDEYALSGVPVAYIGFDATANSLHVGHMVSIMMLRRLQQAGGKPIVLMGGGTTKVGDPTDKEKSRPILTEEEIQSNIASIKSVFEKFLTFGDGPTDAVMVNNDDWLSEIKYIDFLREYGKLFTINKMITQETVKRRLENEQPYTFLEFNYALLQAYDFLELNRRYGCRLQMGGSDQWGNITNGTELCRRCEDVQAFGFTTPLITTASGAKMGKTVGGAVWLNADMKSPYDYWQFWRNTEDADVIRFMKLFTDMPLDEIARYEAMTGKAINDAKIALADAATTLLHGADATAEAKAAAEAVFAQGSVAEGMPSFDVPGSAVEGGYNVQDAFVASGLAKSKGEVKRHIKAGAAKLNGETITSDDTAITSADLDKDNPARLSIGKKRHARMVVV